MWSICRKEISQFFSSLTGYIAIIIFLLLNGVFLFLLPESSIFEYGYAILDQFFNLAPWVLLFLIPAISMRSLSDEFKTGTFEILRTKPLTSLQIVVGKYFSILIIIAFALIPTVTYVITINSLSSTAGVDSGGIAGSYIGLFLLAATFASISLCCSGLTSNAIVAFLLSAFVSLILYYGFEALGKISFFRGNADYYLEMLGIDYHYRSISRGVVDSRDVVYFFSLVFLMIFTTTKRIQKIR